MDIYAQAMALAVFALLAGAALIAMRFSSRLPAHHRSEDTALIVRHIANVFVVMTSLVFGLMINSAKDTFETIDKSMHAFATELILLDRSLRSYGQDGTDARKALIMYVEVAIQSPARTSDGPHYEIGPAERSLNAIGDALGRILPDNGLQASLLVDARQQFHRIVERRWSIVEQSEGVLPMPMVYILIAWLTLIFASFGFRAPQNAIVIAAFLSGALLISAAFYFVLDMDIPFSGAIEVSDAPLRRALAELKL
ncbi:hypothetical protein [Ferrovibrio sp.]|uniref:bestrophin-like domain n=1 Tax=Ferrovibrio sp. TaxID=1917215 RepID=UPI003D291121